MSYTTDTIEAAEGRANWQKQDVIQLNPAYRRYIASTAAEGPQGHIKVITDDMDKPFQHFEEVNKGVEDMRESIDEALVSRRLGDFCDDFWDLIVIVAEVIHRRPAAELGDAPSPAVNELLHCLRGVVASEVVEKLADLYPIDAVDFVKKLPPGVRYSFAALAYLVKQCPTEEERGSLVSWLGDAMIPPDWHDKGSGESPSVKLCAIFKEHKTKTRVWALISPSNELTVRTVATGEVKAKFDVDHIDISRSGESVRIWQQITKIGARFSREPRMAHDVWVSPDPLLPWSLAWHDVNVPEVLVQSFLSALSQHDTYVLRALFEVLKTGVDCDASREGMSDLYALFCASQKVHRLLAAAIAMDPGNLSYARSLYLAYHLEFSKEFFVKAFMPLLDQVNPTLLTAGNEEKLAVAVENAVIGFLKMSKLWRPQIRHFASLLRARARVAFGGKRKEVFQVVSRFIIGSALDAFMAMPDRFDSRVAPGRVREISQFIAIVRQILTLDIQRLEARAKQKPNDLVLSRMSEYFGDIYNFTMEAAFCETLPDYPTPSADRVQEAAKRLMQKMQERQDEFCKAYERIYDCDANNSHVSFAMSELLAGLFRQ